MTTLRKHWSSLARWQKSLAVAAVLLVLYTLFGFFLLPRIIEYVLVEKVSPVLERQVSVGKIHFNPFMLTLDVPDFAINDRDSDEKFVSFDALHADLEMASLVRLAVVLRNIQLSGPRLHIRLDEEGKSNFEDLVPAQSPEEERTGAAIFPIIVEPFDVQNGTVIFEDKTRGVTHTVDQINFHVPHFSSRKKDWEVFMTPSLSFHLNGAPFHLQGQTIPFHDSLKTEFNLELMDLSLPQYWAYAPVSGGLELSKGSLTLENKLAFEQHEGKLPTFSIQGTVTGRDIEMTDQSQTVFTAKQAQVVMDDISILNLDIGLKSVSLDDPFVRVVRKKDGSINWTGYFAAEPAPAAGNAAKSKTAQNATNTTQANATQANATTAANNTTEQTNASVQANTTAQGNASVQGNTTNPANATTQATAQQANASGPEQGQNASITPDKEAQAKSTEEVAHLLLHVPSITLSGGRIQFLDETTKAAFSKELSDLKLSVQDLSTAKNATSAASLSLTTNAKETITANATFSLSPVRFNVHVTATGLDVPSYGAYFQEALPLNLASAKTDAQFSLTLDSPGTEPRLENGKVEIRDLKLGVPNAPDAVTIKRAALDAIALDLKTHTVRTGVLVVEEPKLLTSADKNGRSGLMAHLAASDAPAQKTSPAPAAKSAPDPAWNVQIGGINVTGAAVQVSGKTPATPVQINKFQVDAITLDTAKRSAIVQKVALGFGLDIRLLKNGDIDLAQLFSAPQSSGKDQPQKATKTQSNEPAWNARVDQFLVADSKLRFTDETPAKPTSLDIDQISLDAKKLSTDLTKTIPLTFSCRVEEAGTIRAEGDLTPDPLSSKGTINLSRLPLSVATPYMTDVAAVDISSGWLNGRLNWRIAPKNAGEISGAVKAENLRVTEARSKTEISGFKSLDLQNIRVKLSPLAISVDQVTLVEPRGSLVINPDGKSTIDRITPAQSKKPAPAAKKKPSQGESVSLEVKTVTVQKGKFSFEDKSLSPQFASTISPVDMTVTGISLDPARRVQIDLSAIIDGSAPMTVKGWVAPLKNPVETNSTVSLRNLDLVSLSPYSSKFIAYPVTKGQLDWEMKVTTQASNLAMGNAITARQLELGDKVESPDAADVPVKLGLALLRDMSGNIAITLPVRGDLNDPKFSIGGIVIQAFLGLILKAVTSPFSLLGSLIPEGSPDLNRLQFPAGLATPTEETMTAMQTLADVLEKRPGMNISIVGHADPATDKQALFDLQFLRKLQVVKYNDLSRKEREQTTPEQLEITKEEYPKLLWQAYKDEPVEKDKNALGIHRDVPPEVQEEKLKELINITDDDLIRLATNRAEFVKNYLVGELKADPNRVFLGATGSKSLSGAHEVTVEIKN